MVSHFPAKMRILYMKSTSVVFVVLFLFTGIAELCLCTSSTSSRCIEPERQALLNFKASLSGSSSLHVLSTWEGYDCCEWEGIACDNVTGHVVQLDLRDPCLSPFQDFEEELTLEAERGYCINWLAEYVNPSLPQLEYLSYLDLTGILITRSTLIPMFFGSMRRLRHLSLPGDAFQGMIPGNLGNLTNLRVLHVDNSDGDELYCDDISWLAQISSLEYLGMDGVQLGKAHNLFQVLNMLPSLSKIHLIDCGLEVLPILHHPINVTNLASVQVLILAQKYFKSRFLDAFQNMTSIRVLGLSSNGSNLLPSWLAKLPNLIKLDLSGFNNPTLDALRNMTSFRVLDLSYNNLAPVPQWLDKFNNLVSLSLAGNNFSGHFPYAFQNMTSIRVLDLDSMDLSSVPPWLCEFKNLVKLDLAGNLLHGPIPVALRNLTSLVVLDLSANYLTSIPLWLGELKSLIHLSLSSNNFTNMEEGSLSSIMRNLCGLKVIDLSRSNGRGKVFGSNTNLSGCNSYDLELLDLTHNKFGDNLPAWLGQFENLKHLYLGSNSFFSPIPFSLRKLSDLLVLDLSSNHFDGFIPESFKHLQNLEDLDLSSNSFNGVIPQSLGQLKNIIRLDLSSNFLKGTITDIKSWPPMMDLTYLLLSNNRIGGSFPKNLSDIMPNLRSLLLDNNYISGSIPSSFCKIETLSYLRISKNRLSGKIPDCWRNGHYLFELNMSSNKLSGEIPSSLGNLSSLRGLHLNNNSLHGELPSSWTNLRNLLILDAGENQLSGVMPSWESNTFPKLAVLRLRRNMFNGSIPLNLCHFATLQILDLADNNLTGPIPNCIGNFTGMVSNDRPNIIFNSDGWFDEDVKQVIKGRELDYTRNLKFLVNLDLSNNNLVGSIPERICSLFGLIGLNLSYNNLSGEIPKMMGDMKSLESIDFSHNQLFGTIPRRMSSLTSLSHLNLSYNNFKGPIPKENQFLTFNDPSIYAGNPYLCGTPLLNICPGDVSHQLPHTRDNEDGEKDRSEKVWFYFVIALGFATGFWGVIGVLLLKKSWRHACFRCVDEVADKVYAAVVIKLAKLKKMMQRNCDDK